MSFMEKIFGDLNAKEVKKVAKIADKVEAYDQQMQEMSDQQLRDKTDEFKERLKMVRHWMIFCRKRLLYAGKHP